MRIPAAASCGTSWRAGARRGAPAVVNLQPPTGSDLVQRRTAYRTVEDDHMVVEVEVGYRWWTISPDQLLTELAGAGLTAQRHDPDLYVIRRNPR